MPLVPDLSTISMIMTNKEEKLRVGDWVEVRSKEEILATLDRNGWLDGMPFMPEMFAFCGQKLQVYKSAHKTCDTVFPVRGRRVDRAVHLDTRCDGAFHGGCQAGCMLFWKEAWLKPAGGGFGQRVSAVEGLANRNQDAMGLAVGCTEADVTANAESPADGVRKKYVCQATRLPYASSDLEWWEVGQYIDDYRSGNIGLWRLICGAVYFLYFELSRAGVGLGRPMRWFYDKFYYLWGGSVFPRRTGSIRAGESTPIEPLNLQPGELVQIKPYHEILKTLNVQNRNRGLYFDAEEVPYCGGTYRVLRRVERIVNERTGEMLEMRVPCIILDTVICEGRYSECRLFCPRSIYSYWRELWLERADPKVAINTKSGTGQSAARMK
jgi:hypothetical protein